MAERQKAEKSKKPKSQQQQNENCASGLLRVEFVINTYPDLQPFLEMAVLLLEGVYEHKRMLDEMTPAPTNSGED